MLFSASPESEDEVNSGFLLDVVVSHGAGAIKLLAREDETLLVGGDALSSVDLSLHTLDGVGGLDVNSNGLASQRLNEHLHGTTAQAEHEVQG